MENTSLVVAFGSGLLSFLSPCSLPVVRVYIASLAGPDVLVPGTYNERTLIFLHSVSFVVGFTAIFVIMPAGAGFAGFALSSHLATIRQIAAVLLICLGLIMLASLKIPQLNYEKHLSMSRGTTTGYLSSLLIGAIFSLAWTPSAGRILGGILALAWSYEEAWHGAYLLGIYSLGLGIPLLVIGAAFDSVNPLLKRIGGYSAAIYIVSGVLLTTVGTLILTKKLIWF
jgi:cytochrome c-type biogenesis protein